MKLVAIQIPEEPAQFVGWLERQLVGPDLAALVGELAAVHAAEPTTSSGLASSLVADWAPQLRLVGLNALPADVLRHLLQQPYALFELQELVLGEASPYWDRLLREEASLDGPVREGRNRLADLFGEPDAPEEQPRTLLLPQRPRWFRRPSFVAFATAASLLLAFAAVVRYAPSFLVPTPPPSAWGWQKPDVRTAKADDAAYLRGLADAAGDYFKKRPDDAASLARRIGEFRQGCTALIFAEHPLKPDNRTWLREKCVAWAGKIDGHLQALEKGDDLAAVRDGMDATVRQIQKVLNERADLS